MTSMTLTITGMHCSHCVMKVKQALGALPGVEVRKVEIGKADLAVDEARTSADALRRAVEGAGYQVAA
jgi:copper chaperone